MNRKFHRLSAWIAGGPILVILCTGILLQMKSWIPWVQPPTQKGSTAAPFLDLNSILRISRSIPWVQVQNWKDIRSIDIRPSTGVARVRTRSEYEISIDLGTGQV